MKLLTSIFIILISFCNAKVSGQETSKYVTFILLVDDEVPTGFVWDFALKISDGAGKLTDSIRFDYEVGKLVFHTPLDYKKFSEFEKKLKVSFQFWYQSPYPAEEKSMYTQSMTVGDFREKYMIFKVFNYSNKKNRGKFFRKQGYGVEYRIQSYQVDIPKTRH